MRTFMAKANLLRAATLLLAALPALAWADPTCVYVIGQVGGQSFTTPAVVVFVPDTTAEVQPVRVHVDEVNETILGYSLRADGVDLETDPLSVFVPGVDETIPSVSLTLPELGTGYNRCVDQGVSTPAVPVYVPGSVLTTPGAIIETPRIELNLLDRELTAEGHVIELPSKTIVIPDRSTEIPGVSAETPEMTLVVEIDGTQQPATYLPPNE